MVALRHRSPRKMMRLPSSQTRLLLPTQVEKEANKRAQGRMKRSPRSMKRRRRRCFHGHRYQVGHYHMRRRTLDVNKTCARPDGAAREAQRWRGGGGSLDAYIALIDDDSLCDANQHSPISSRAVLKDSPVASMPCRNRRSSFAS
jgi:hypothetical protein